MTRNHEVIQIIMTACNKHLAHFDRSHHQNEYLMMNIDAAIFQQLTKFGIGCCIRDDHGTFISAKTTHFEGLPEPREAEANGSSSWITLGSRTWSPTEYVST